MFEPEDDGDEEERSTRGGVLGGLSSVFGENWRLAVWTFLFGRTFEERQAMKRPTNNSKHNFRYSPDNSDGLGNRNSRFGYQHGSNSRLRGNTFDSIPDISSKTAVPGFPETFNISRLSRSATMPHGNGSNEPALPPGVSKDPTRKYNPFYQCVAIFPLLIFFAALALIYLL